MAVVLASACLVLSLAPFGACWMYYAPLSAYAGQFINSFPDTKHAHSEYRYGMCDRTDIVLYTHVHLDSLQFLGKLFVRGWLDIRRIPTCIILRAKALQRDLFRSTAFPFQICVPRITYCHSHKRFRYYYYEWHIPFGYEGGMDWDLYFFGSPSLWW